jgi:hypothetical protein
MMPVVPVVVAPVVVMPMMPVVMAPVVMVPMMPAVMMPPMVVVVVPADLFRLEAIDLVLSNDRGLRAVGARRYQAMLK